MFVSGAGGMGGGSQRSLSALMACSTPATWPAGRGAGRMPANLINGHAPHRINGHAPHRLGLPRCRGSDVHAGKLAFRGLDADRCRPTWTATDRYGPTWTAAGRRGPLRRLARREHLCRGPAHLPYPRGHRHLHGHRRARCGCPRLRSPRGLGRPVTTGLGRSGYRRWCRGSGTGAGGKDGGGDLGQVVFL
jgi:hypothetical protein